MSARLAALLREKTEEFVEHLRYRNYADSTRRNYRYVLQNLANWVEQEKQLEHLVDLTPKVLARFWHETSSRPPMRGRKRGQKQLSVATLRFHACGVRAFFKELTRKGELLQDPSQAINRPRTTKTFRGTVLSRREMLKLLMVIGLETPGGIRDRAIVELLYSTGIRRAELIGIELGQLDLDEGWLRVLGKGNRQRYVPVGREAELALKNYLTNARPCLAAPGEPALFVNRRGTRYNGNKLARLLHQLAREAGIKKRVTPHVLRHTCATHMLAGKADIRYIQALLGHTSLSSTEIYTQVRPSDLRRTLLNCHPRERDF